MTETQGKTGTSLKRNTAWTFVGLGMGIGLRAVYFIVIARLLGVLDYGIVVGAFAMVNLVAEHARLGTGMVLVRHVAPDHKRFAAYWGSSLFVTFGMSLLLIVALHFLAPHVLDPKTAAIVAFTAAGSCLFEQLTVSAMQAFQAFQQMRMAAMLNQMTSLLRTVVAVTMLLVMHHATAGQWAMASMCASAVGTVAALIIVTARLGWPKFAPLLALRHSGEGLEYSIASSATWAYNDLDKTMLSHYGMSASNGIYGMAYRIIEMGSVPATSLQLAATPRLFELAGAGPEGPVRLGKKLLSKSVLISLCATVGMFLLAPLIPYVVGHDFNGGVEALRWVCLIPVFRSIHGMTGNVLTSIGRQRYRTCTQIGAVALNFLLNLWMIPAFGWRGAAWSSLMTDGALALANWVGMVWLSRRAISTAQAVSAAENVTAEEIEEAAALPELSAVLEPAGVLEPGAVLESDAVLEKPLGKPLVTVVVPYFNHPGYVVEAIESALKQSYEPMEVIVVDDGSAEPAAGVIDVEALTKRYPTRKISMLRKENGGVGSARNVGFAESKGEYIIFLDSDDRLRPGAIEAQIAELERNPKAGMVFGAASIIDEFGRETSPASICRARDNYFLMLLVINPIACPGGVMMRREALLKTGPFDESYRNAEDYQLYLRMGRLMPIARNEVCVVDYRRHTGGKSQNKERMILAVMRILDEQEQSGLLSRTELRRLRHGRERWLHVFRPETTLRYRLRDYYFRFHAMTTVPLRSYFGPRGNNAL